MSILLSDLRVIDLTDDFGEAAGRVLADLGAEVIKVEPPSGCASRHRGASDADGLRVAEAALASALAELTK